MFAAAEILFKAVDNKNIPIALFGDELRAFRTRYFLLFPIDFEWRLSAIQQAADLRISASALSKMDSREIPNANGAAV